MSVLETLFPHVMENPDVFVESLIETLQMFFIASPFWFVFGIFFGLVLAVTKKGGLLENRPVFEFLDKLVNLCRSIPFVIMIALLFPLTRLIAGTAIGVEGAIFPLIVGITPFFSRQVESVFNGLNPTLIESAQSMGFGPLSIIWHVYLRESIAGLARVTTITCISFNSEIAVIGAIGAGGLGDYANRYGFERNQLDVTVAAVIALLIFITIIQTIGTLVGRKNEH
ncbi:ABC transporter permease [Bifidobacterium reuteri]|uniref:ABC transporter, permease protein n=2 Tax=Bifidobacterium reuteri TaxID=983706 RepID=A0A087CVF5_9BIFI|nr:MULTISPECIES: methionine ABC transporter permease [Bifidobacterium]KAA8825308.1 ABC transporter permease [Bifidobacterium reuteri]KFI87255.1 ABC transporter, permease protein [Bifidobacterium reuteri DSM 23975]TPF77846.1 ABC transporter permease [Bifidobacterium sp. UTCIF-1]TPF79374.1 ABC transporter permease [Bifidobacterium sp. UTCIF-24]TPF81897.1 ABC transporter permease [Bifidobacterium sp. UTCIF-3]